MRLLSVCIFILVITASITATGPSVFAQSDCTAIDLKNTPGLGPIRHEKGNASCYAAASADLLGVRYYEKLKGQQISSALIALQYNKTLFRPANGGGGYTAPAILSAALRGFCPQWVEDAVSELNADGLQALIESFLALKKRYDRASNELGYLSGPETLRHALDEIDAVQAIYTEWYQKWLTQFPARTDITLPPDDMMKIFSSSNEKQFILEVFGGFCRNYFVPHFELPRIVMRLRPHSVAFKVGNKTVPPIDLDPYFNLFDSLKKVMDEGLEKGRVVSIENFSEFFYHDYLDSFPRGTTGTHATVVVGRRPSPEGRGCEYLIRNSWGDHCDYEVAKKHPGYCEAGHLWVPESVLRSTTLQVSYLP